MAEEQLQRADSNLKPSELKAAFKRSRDIDALLDEERELKEKEVQLLILGENAKGLINSAVASRLAPGVDKYFIFSFEHCLTGFIGCLANKWKHRQLKTSLVFPMNYNQNFPEHAVHWICIFKAVLKYTATKQFDSKRNTQKSKFTANVTH